MKIVFVIMVTFVIIYYFKSSIDMKRNFGNGIVLNVEAIKWQDDSKSSYPNLGFPDGLGNSCVRMFDIGFQHNKIRPKVNSRNLFGEGYSARDWKRLLKEKKKTIQSDTDYMPLVKSLAKIAVPFQGALKLNNQTRLQIMEGRLPYIPCVIRNYGQGELERCLNARSKLNKRFWMVFMGDSRMRNKFLYFTKRTQRVMKWSLSKEEGKVSQFKDIVNLREYATWLNATSPSGNFMSYVGAVFGLKNNHPPHPIKFLQRLLQAPPKLPDVLIINFGSWEYQLFPIKLGILSSHSTIISIWNKMIKVLKKLSNHTVIICLSLPRPRETSREIAVNMTTKKYMYNAHPVMGAGTQFVDFAMSSFLQNTNIVFWDSTVPFNLASRKECFDLVQHKRQLVASELKKGRPFQRFMCHDQIHKSRSTIHDETTMILNLVCNKFMSQNHIDYCC